MNEKTKLNNNFNVKTKRLKVYPLSDAEIQKLIDDSTDEALAAAYTQMLEGCINNPMQRQWYAPWRMETKDGNHIGELGFRGPASGGSVEIGYGINKEYEGKGYTTEAAKALVEWAFDNEEVIFVEAEADETNVASIRILEKLEFVKYGQGEIGPRFVKSKPCTSYTSIGMSMGLCLGLAIGEFIFKNTTVGMSVGLMLGLCFGAAKDAQEKKKITEIKKEKYGLSK